MGAVGIILTLSYFGCNTLTNMNPNTYPPVISVQTTIASTSLMREHLIEDLENWYCLRTEIRKNLNFSGHIIVVQIRT